MTIKLEVLRRFDAKAWQTAHPLSPPGETTLITWEEEPPSIDAGVPKAIQSALAACLCELGVVVYAASAAVDELPVCAEVSIRKGFRTPPIRFHCAKSAADLLPAFTDSKHDWTMSAQWLVVLEAAAGVGKIHALLEQLFGDWTLPEVLRPPVLMVIQAAVDGDGAACYSANSRVQDQFLNALERSADHAGIELTVQT